jgi:hypothetical protein
MTLKYQFIVLFFISILIISCDKKSNDQATGPQTISPTTIVPLVIGNQWSYIDSTYNTNGTVNIDSSFLAITGKSTIQYQNQSLEVFHWNWLDKKTLVPQDWKWLSRNESDGLYMYGGASSKGVFQLGRSQNHKYPTTVGEFWQRISFITGVDSTFRIGDTSIVHCLATDEVFNTPAGSFRAYVTNYQSSGLDIYLYYVPNIGYVGLIDKQNGRMTFKKTMKTYRVSTN